jgi:hypothetical protein
MTRRIAACPRKNARSVSVVIPRGDLMQRAADTLRFTEVNISELFNNAMRAYSGEPIESLPTRSETPWPDSGGVFSAAADADLIDSLDVKMPRAVRIGLAMIGYGMTRDEAIEWEKTSVNRGRSWMRDHRARQEQAETDLMTA